MNASGWLLLPLLEATRTRRGWLPALTKNSSDLRGLEAACGDVHPYKRQCS